MKNRYRREELEPLATTSEDILVVSDWHLPVGNVEDILSVLASPFKKLIINGDLLDYRFVAQIDQKHHAILRKMEQLEAEGRLVATIGNHEQWLRHISKITALKFRENLILEQHGKRFFISHGHRLCSIFSKKNLKKNAIRFAKENRFDAVLVGHNHIPELEHSEGVLYANSGAFVGSSCSGLVIGEGDIQFLGLPSQPLFAAL